MKLNRMPPLIFRAALVLLCLVVLTSGMMGRLFAKYYATASGSDSARVARFGQCSVSMVDYAPIAIKTTIDTNKNVAENQQGTYVLVAKFKVELEDTEVSTKYNLILTLDDGDNDTSTTLKKTTFLLANANEKFLMPQPRDADNNAQEPTTITTIDDLGIGLTGSFSTTELYCLISTDGTKYSKASQATLTDDVVEIIGTFDVNSTIRTHYYQIVYFLNEVTTESDFENSIIMYNLEYIQVD